MAFDKDAININTSGPVLFNTNSQNNKSMLNIDFWNDLICYTMCPLLPKDQWANNNGKKHDTKTKITSRIKGEKAQELLQSVMLNLENFISDTEFNVSVLTGSGTLTVSNGIQFGFTEPTMVLVICNNIDSDSGIPDTIIYYEFKNESYISNYITTSGEYGTSELKTTDGAQFMVWLKSLAEFVKTFNNASAHSVYHSQDYLVNCNREFLRREGFFGSAKKNNSNNNGNSHFNKDKLPASNPTPTSTSVDSVDKDELNKAVLEI